MDFKEKIKKVRIEIGYSQEQLARELGVSFATINRWENGKTVPNMKAMKQMKDFCEKNGFSFGELEKAWLEQTKNK